MKNWWEKSGIFYRFSIIENKQSYRELIKKLPQIRQAGFNAIEILPPYHGGDQYGGLDVIDFYNVHPDTGTLADLKDFLHAAHSLGFHVIACINIGYAAVENADFVKACKDVGENISSRERDIFIWSDTPDKKMDKPYAPYFLQDGDGEWVYHETAGKYFWCKWRGTGWDVRMPQYNFASPYWQEECKKIIHFWLDQGYDGFMVDAVNWYIDCDWEINRKCIIEPAQRDGPVFIQPEGGSGFHDDPVTWITKGGYTNVQDYSLCIWWEKGSEVLENAKRDHDVTKLWQQIEASRNPVVEANGTTYMGLGQGGDEKQPDAGAIFEVGLLFAIGEQILYLDTACKNGVAPEISELFRLQEHTPALSVQGRREKIRKVTERSVFAVRCIDGVQGNDVYAVFNFGVSAFPFVHPLTQEDVPVEPMSFVYLDPNGTVIFSY